MPRPLRRVVPGVPHHITQRGSRRQPVFFNDEGRRFYLRTLADYCARHDVRCRAWCLMNNHIHLVLVPPTEDGLRAVLAPTHTRYSNAVNRAQGWTGSLFEGRYWSYPMTEAHAMIAIRYVENNPVAAGLVARAEDWRWSSARAHVSRRPDKLTDLNWYGDAVPNWSAMLARGLEAADENEIVERSLRRGVLATAKSV
jgi:putative transposase